ncbi:hypothetical protein EON82_17760 [bacterium]|nr:MAG: hypothetical protein EON82_17760 [bacterium]
MTSEGRSALIGLLETIKVDPDESAVGDTRLKALLRRLRYEHAISIDKGLATEDVRVIRGYGPKAYDALAERHGLPRS